MSIKYSYENVITEFWKNGGPSFPHERENLANHDVEQLPEQEPIIVNPELGVYDEDDCNEPEIGVEDVVVWARKHGWDGEAVCGKDEIYVEDVVYQDYGSEFGVAPHWAVQYYIKGQGWPCYDYFSSREEAYGWARKHGWPN